jgi:EmrB/QacA subfamily drug resistance transporter
METTEEQSSTSILEASIPLAPRRRIAVTAGIIMGLFLAAIEQTVVATAMPTVVAALGGLNIYSWVFSAYLLTFTISVPIWGRLSDMYGRRSFYLIAIGLFLLGSALCGQARSMTFLIIARAIQGLGGGGVFPIGLTIVGEIYSLEQRARMQGLFSGVWGFASIVGPLAGGIITDLLSWRWVFYVNLPFGFAAIALIYANLKEKSEPGRSHAIDYGGVVTLSASLTFLLVGLIRAGKRGTFVDPALLSLFVLAFVLFAVFIVIERRAAEPLLPISLFETRAFRVCSGVGFLAGMGLFGSISFIPLFVQGVLFGSATQAGSALTPLMLGWVVFSIISGRLLLKLGYRPVVIGGMAFFMAGFLGLSRMGPTSAYADLLPSMAVLGAGMGLAMVAILLAVQNTVPRRLMGTATSANLFFRTIGGTVGVAIMGSVMAHRLTVNLGGTTDPQLVELATNPDSIVGEATRRMLRPEALDWLRTALADSLENVFVVGTFIAAVALLLAFAFPSGTAEELAHRPASGSEK